MNGALSGLAGRLRSRPAWLSWTVPPFVLLTVSLLALGSGRFPLPFQDVMGILTAELTGRPVPVTSAALSVFLHVRLPRVLAGLLVGGALSTAGAVYQGMFRNPLVSPDILGVSAGAGLGTVIGIFAGWPVLAIESAAFAGGLAAVAAVYALASVLPRDDRTMLLLTGIAVAALLDAGMTLLKIMADPYTQLPTITTWLMGSLNGATLADLKGAILPALLGLIPLWLLRWRINLLCLDEVEAQALGVPTTVLRTACVAAATLMTSAAVAISGAVGWHGLGWVGLVIPHVARLLVGPDFTRLIPASLMLGAGFMVAMDSLARTIAATEVPLGILISLVGVPFFLWLLATQRKSW